MYQLVFEAAAVANLWANRPSKFSDKHLEAIITYLSSLGFYDVKGNILKRRKGLQRARIASSFVRRARRMCIWREYHLVRYHVRTVYLIKCLKVKQLRSTHKSAIPCDEAKISAQKFRGVGSDRLFVFQLKELAKSISQLRKLARAP
jgi:hypothetical protein